VLHQIGVGALGPVFRTYEPTRDRLVAVKVFRLDVTPEQAQALADELAHAAEAELFHASIVEPIASGVEGTVAYRAEEYVAAESLDVAMRHYAPASFDTMMRIIGQLAEAIDVARRAGVGHGALHPRDIFVTPDEARASGFGVVDALERVGLRAPVRRPYSAPERIAGGEWSTQADVFSLGAIAFELLTGRRPSGTGRDIGPLTGAIVPGAHRLEGVLARAMHEDPSERFATGLALADALASAGALGADAPAPADDAAEPVAESSFDALPTPIPAAAHAFADEGDDDVGTVDERPLATEGGSAALGLAPEPEPSEEPWHAAGVEGDTHSVESHVIARSDESPRYAEIEVEPSPDRLRFEDAEVGLHGERTSPSGSREAYTSRTETPPAPLEVEQDFEPVPPPHSSRYEERPAAFAAPSLFDRTPPAPPQVIEREVPSDLPHDSDDRIPYEPFMSHGAHPERTRSAMLPVAVGLIAGLLIGFGAGAWWRSQAATTRVDSTDAAARPADAQPPGQPAGTRGTPTDSDRPVPPGSAAPTAPPAPAREFLPPRPTTPAPAPSSVRSGSLAVRSVPSGAAVTINGKWSGRTPLTRETLPFGDYAVRVILPGYQTRQEQVSLSADSVSRTLSVQLQREIPATRPAAPAAGAPSRDTSANRQPSGGSGSSASTEKARAQTPAAPAPDAGVTTGTLEIDSRPVGARVFVDDRPVGTTPVRIADVAPGSRVVRLEMPDHRSWTEVAQVGRGKTTRVAGSLEPIR
jgi:serine/threonine protein kinase